MSRPLGAGVWWGGLVVLLGVWLCYWGVSTLIERAAEPRSLSVEEAVDAARTREELPNVHLRDLVVDCDQATAIGKHAYAPGTGSKSSGDRSYVLLLLDPDERCEDLAAAARGRVDLGAPELRTWRGRDGHEPVVLTPHEPIAWVVALAVGLVALGGFGIRSGLRTSALDLAMRPTEPDPTEATTGDPFRTAVADDALLRRPLRLSERWLARAQRQQLVQRVIVALLGFGAVGLIVGFSAGSVRMFRVWNDGVDATHVTLGGEERSRAFVVHSVDLTVTYTDRAGTGHHGEVWYLALGSGIDTSASLAVRYDPENPSSFATSWEVDSFVGELLATLLGLGMIVGVAASIFLVGRLRFREIADARETIHAGAEELVLRVIDARNEIVNGEHVRTIYVLEFAHGPRIERARPPRQPPFLLDAGRNEILALRHPHRPDLIVLLDPDLGPLDTPPGEGERIRIRYRKLLDKSRGDAGRGERSVR